MRKIILIVIILVIISLLIALSINSKNKDYIKFGVLYNGFITMNLALEDLPPSGPVVFTSYEQWEEFGKKYIPKHYQPLYSYMTRDEGADFNNDYLVLYSSVGAQTWYNRSFTSVEKVLISDNRIKIVFSEEEKAKDILNAIYTENEQVEAAHPNILILKVKKDDIPNNLMDIYSNNQNY